MNTEPAQPRPEEQPARSRRVVILAIVTVLAGILAVLSLLNDSELSAIVYKAF